MFCFFLQLFQNIFSFFRRDGDQNEDDVEDDEPETWLESLGLSQDNFPSLTARKRYFQLNVFSVCV